MYQSRLFTKTMREEPSGEIAASAILLERGGFAFKNSAGVYTLLPLGWRVIERINTIVREEMNAIGGQEMLMPALIERRYMEATGRWNMDVGFRAHVRGEEDEAQFVLGWSHEDILAAMAVRFINSYRDLPLAVYQIQTKFRNEARAKSGLLRGREFMMKDLYSFHATQEDLFRYYAEVRKAYESVFHRCSLETYYTLAGGGVFTLQNTHEFQVLSDIGEDTIFFCKACGYAENDEVATLKEGAVCTQCGAAAVQKGKSIEVGNIFPLGTKYAQATGLFFADERGEKKPVVMGSYGIGISRLMATVVEIHRDERGIVWPESLAPFTAHLLLLDESQRSETDALYRRLRDCGIAVLYDERQGVSAGERFADADILGIPYRVVASKKTAALHKYEVKRRDEQQERLVEESALREICRTKQQK